MLNTLKLVILIESIPLSMDLRQLFILSLSTLRWWVSNLFLISDARFEIREIFQIGFIGIWIYQSVSPVNKCCLYEFSVAKHLQDEHLPARLTNQKARNLQNLQSGPIYAAQPMRAQEKGNLSSVLCVGGLRHVWASLLTEQPTKLSMMPNVSERRLGV